MGPPAAVPDPRFRDQLAEAVAAALDAAYGYSSYRWPQQQDCPRIADALMPVVDRIAGKRAAEELRAMAAELSDSDQYVEIALGGAAYVQTWLSDRAAALDAEEGQ